MATADNAAQQRPDADRGGLLARHPLISFFVMAYAFSWIVWSPWYLSEDGVGLLPYELSDTVGGLLNTAALIAGPTLSAFIVTGATEGRAAIRHLLRRIVRWRVGFEWYLFVLIGIPLIMLLGAIILPGTLASFEATSIPSGLTYLGFFVGVTIFGGPLFEEIGWRGFALPHLQPLRGPLVASLILGLLWSLWHLPLFLTRTWDTPHGSLLDIVLFVVSATAVAIIFTWVFNNTRGSVLMAILGHASLNVFGTFLVGAFPTPIMTASMLGWGTGSVVAAVLIIVLTRGHLGYREEEPELAAAPT